jgi:hypothetical protein
VSTHPYPNTTTGFTAWVAHGRKRIAYLQIASLQNYLLLSTVDQVIEHYHRGSSEAPFTYSAHKAGDKITLNCPPGALSVDAIFAAQQSLVETR